MNMKSLLNFLVTRRAKLQTMRLLGESWLLETDLCLGCDSVYTLLGCGVTIHLIKKEI
jgi:hypothetical protein